ncbi:hypothetical protein HPB51_015164 [Rhipicephalus microplus]|uniref:Uncharacterized protein n=1 Tax=Rhipicephalus microplus TaxID=6941 RepID=A0A9J6DNN5_RHIMP|nr:hypothetical protein HPB51_015164 [Rhipicephalus microplus]
MELESASAKRRRDLDDGAQVDETQVKSEVQWKVCGIQRSYPCCGNMVCWRGRCINKKEDRKGYVYPPDNYFPPPWYFQRFVPVYPVNFRP